MHIFASWPYLGVGSANLRKRFPNGDEGEEEGDEEEEEEPEFDSSGDDIP